MGIPNENSPCSSLNDPIYELAIIHAPLAKSGGRRLPPEKLLRAMLLQAFYSIRSKTRIEQLQADLAELEMEKNCLEASVAEHRADFERERDRCDRLIAETLALNKVAMSARENAARLEGEAFGRQNRRRWWGRRVTRGRGRGQRPRRTFRSSTSLGAKMAR